MNPQTKSKTELQFPDLISKPGNKDRHELIDQEIALLEKLDEQCVPGFESSWNSERAWAIQKYWKRSTKM